jgi:serine/threonine protein phosphatase PrpC
MASSSVGTFARARKGEDHSSILHAEVDGEVLVMLCVADGHGGAEAALHCKSCALTYIKEEAATGGEGLRAACARVFGRLHDEVVARCGTAGTTLTVVIINETRKEVTCANVGDSSAMLVTADGHEFISTDHRLEACPEERKRVLAQGATIAQAISSSGGPGGPIRAWPGGLAVARTIGDADCSQIVSAEPALRTVSVSSSGVVIICSDGCWDALPPEKVASLGMRVTDRVTTAQVAERIVSRAVKARGLRDDTTCIVVAIGDAIHTRTSPMTRRFSAFSVLRSSVGNDAADSSRHASPLSSCGDLASLETSSSRSPCSKSPSSKSPLLSPQGLRRAFFSKRSGSVSAAHHSEEPSFTASCVSSDSCGSSLLADNLVDEATNPVRPSRPTISSRDLG